MSGESSAGAPGPLVPLAWDTDNFGFPVARLVVPEGGLTAAADALAQARQREIALVYWQTEPTVEVPRALLAEFGGSLMDRKATFAADLSAVERGGSDECAGDLCIREYPFGKASEALRVLAVSAGAFSRYGRDPLFPNDKFVAMYLTWIERSTRHELADVVLEAAAEGADPLGFVTVAEAAGVANIGLIAVSAEAQGRGLGRLLMRAAHRWMIGRGATRATVVTQQDNVPACRLYERCAYRLAEVKHYYHFWPLAGRRRVLRLPLAPKTVMDLSIVIPVYRSSQTLEPLTARLREVLDRTGLDYEIIFVEDGSPDDSWRVLQSLRQRQPERIVAIQLMRNYGQHNALMCGFRHAHGDFVVTMDDDLQNPPEEIPKLIEAIKRGDYDLVYGSYGGKKHSAWRNLSSGVVNAFYRRVFRSSVTVTSFRIIRRPLLESIFAYNLNFTFIDGLLAWNTQRIGQAEVEHRPRAEGRSGYSLTKLTMLALNLFTNFSLLPLQMVSLVGLLTALLGLLVAVYYLVLYLMSAILVPGYASTIIAILVLGGVQLLSLGIMGEYLGRLHLNVNRKPQYVERQVLNPEPPAPRSEV